MATKPGVSLDSATPELAAAILSADAASVTARREASPEALRAAIADWRQIADSPDLARAAPELRAEVLNSLGGLHLDRWYAAGQDQDRDAAIRVFEEALEQLPGPSGDTLRANLASALLVRFDGTGDPAALERAVELLESMLAQYAPDAIPAWLAAVYANALKHRYARAGDLDDLERQIALLRGPAAANTGPGARTRRLNALGNALSDHYAITSAASDLDESIACLEEALDADPMSTGPARAMTMANLGASLRERHNATGDRADLDRAIRCQQEAVALAPHVWGFHNNLALALLQRAQERQNRQDLDRAIAGFRRVLDNTAQASPDLPGYLRSYASALEIRSGLERSDDDFLTAVEAYQTACVFGLQTNVDLAFEAALEWAIWAASRESWEEAAAAWEYGLAASERLIRAQLVRGGKATRLRRAQDLPPRAAYALAKVGRLEDAVLTVERGRAQLLSDRLDRNGAALTHLEDAGRSDLVHSFRAAAAQLEALDGGEVTGALREARAEYERVVQEIRSVPGNERFLAEPALTDLTALAAEDPLIYLLTTEAGGLALIVRRGRIEPVWLDTLGIEAVFEQLGDYLRGLLAKEGRAGGDWPTALDRTAKWIWDAAMEDVMAAIQPAARVRVVAIGPLAVLPLHAAWTADPDAPTGRRYACDTAVFTYLPNARTGVEAERLAASLPAETLLAVADPSSRLAPPLQGARREAVAVAAAFEPNACVLAGEEATRSAVVARLAGSDVLHFACHGVANVEAPLESALLLAGDERLTVGDLLADRLDARLAVLSACETALTGLELLDEVIGLPSTLLHTGAAGVIGSLWKVPDIDTTLLMAEFYRRWRDLGTPPATALRDAQVWVRDTTNAEKAAAYDVMLARGGGLPRGTVEALRDMVISAAPAEQGFANLVGWAGFTHLGA